MYLKKTYTTFQMAWWTRFETFLFLMLIVLWVSVYYFFDIAWLKIPLSPLALIGKDVAFVIGFQKNAYYVRICEARQFLRCIVNTSRSFGLYVQDMVNIEHDQSRCD